MPDREEAWPERALRWAVVLLSAIFVLLFVAAAVRRLRYPFELDRMESGMLTSVWRVRHGYALYSPPSLEWAPFLYAPLFFWVSAAVSAVAGLGYQTLRLVSLTATLATFGLIFALVWTETRRLAPSMLAVGLFASLYPFVLAWYDVGRVDSLSTCLFLAALLATRRTSPLLAAVFWLLAFLTKQTFLPLGLAMFLIEWQRPRRMLTGMAAYLLLAGGSVLWLNHASHGWFSYYAFGTPGVLGWSRHTAVWFPIADLFAPWPLVLLLVLAAIVRTGVVLRRDSYLLLTTGLLTLAIWYVRAHVGANINAVIPLYAWMAVLAGLALHRLEMALRLVSLTVVRRTALRCLLWALALVQLGVHLYRPSSIPTGDLAARQQFLAALRATPGDVWVVDHSYDALLAGKPLHADMDALDAVLGRGYQPALAAFAQRSATAHWSAVVFDRDPAGYKPDGLFTTPPFSTVYGMRTAAPGAGAPDQPALVLLPCTRVGLPPGGLVPPPGPESLARCPR